MSKMQNNIYFSGSLSKALNLQLAFPKNKMKKPPSEGEVKRNDTTHCGRCTCCQKMPCDPRADSAVCPRPLLSWASDPLLHRPLAISATCHPPPHKACLSSLCPWSLQTVPPWPGPEPPVLALQSPRPSNPSLGSVSQQACQRKKNRSEADILGPPRGLRDLGGTHRWASLSDPSGKGSRGQTPMLLSQLSTWQDNVQLLFKIFIKDYLEIWQNPQRQSQIK